MHDFNFTFDLHCILVLLITKTVKLKIEVRNKQKLDGLYLVVHNCALDLRILRHIRTYLQNSKGGF